MAAPEDIPKMAGKRHDSAPNVFSDFLRRCGFPERQRVFLEAQQFMQCK